MKQAYNTSVLEETTDFFDRVWEASVMKVENLKKHPHIASFIASVAAEPMPELKGAIFSETNEKYIASLVLHEQDYKIQTPGGCGISVSDAYAACKGYVRSVGKRSGL